MKRSPLPTILALAACAFELQGALPDGLVELQLTPAGEFRPSDGRKMDVPAWRIDAAIAAEVIARYAERANPAVIDYEHQTLHKETNGQPAPAAAWIRELVWHEGRGLFARAELTLRAREAIAAGEYRYISPVFEFDARSGAVLAIHMAAITNTPAIDGMAPLALRAAATFGHSIHHEEPAMKTKLLLAICSLLALNPETTTEDQAADALATFDPLAKVRGAIGVDKAVDAATVVAACTALKTKADATATPDPAKFVAVGVVSELQAQVAALSAQNTARAVDDLVKPALADGRLLPAMEPWARELGGKDIAALTAYLDKAPKIAALQGTQSGGEAPVAGNEHQLTAAEIAVCASTGISHKDFAAAKAA
jgi:phage I-like protein